MPYCKKLRFQRFYTRKQKISVFYNVFGLYEIEKLLWYLCFEKSIFTPLFGLNECYEKSLFFTPFFGTVLLDKLTYVEYNI